MTHHVYATSDWELQEVQETKDISKCHVSRHDAHIEGWTKVGTAEVVFTAMPEQEIITGLVEQLNKEITQLQANTELELNKKRAKIQQLLAITME